MYAKSRTVTTIAALACLLAAWAVAQTPSAGAEPAGGAQPAQLQEVWRTDFDGPAGSLPSADDWIIDTGTSYPGGPANWGTGEVQTYTSDPANIQLDGSGHLVITALLDGGTWTSARIETQRSDFAAPDGGLMRIEAALRLPDLEGDAALGYWPAFWTLGADFRGDYWNWPGIGEFDIMENVNGLDQVWGVLHCGVNPGGPCDETQGIGAATACGDCDAGFHEYALELDRTGDVEYLRWYLDGQLYHTVSSEQIGEQTWADATGHGHFLLLNLAMGGAFPDGVAGQAMPTAATQPGGTLVADYVSVSVQQPAG